LRWWRGALKRRAGQFEPEGYVYLLDGGGFFKIGRKTRPDRRIEQMAIQLPWRVSVEHLIGCEDHSEAERALHEKFAAKRTNGEWFELNDEEIAWIKSINRMRGGDIKR
jgi:hypothetical protein